MAKPTQDQITKEIETLKAQRLTVRRYSGFGDDNRAQIDAQIRVAEENMDDDDIAENIGNEQSAAFEMRNWLDGNDEDGSPSEGWAGLCK